MTKKKLHTAVSPTETVIVLYKVKMESLCLHLQHFIYVVIIRIGVLLERSMLRRKQKHSWKFYISDYN